MKVKELLEKIETLKTAGDITDDADVLIGVDGRYATPTECVWSTGGLGTVEEQDKVKLFISTG